MLLLSSIPFVLSAESVDTVKWVNEALLNYDMQTDHRTDSALIIIRQFPRKEYKETLYRFKRFVITEQIDSNLLKLYFGALMAYNDMWSYNEISYGISWSKHYASVANSFCETYDKNVKPLYAPLRFKFQMPDFITDSFVLDKSNLNDFVEKWLAYSSVLMDKEKNNKINLKIQEFYRWEEQIKEEEYTKKCKEKDSLYSTNKQKNIERISDLEDEIKTYVEQKSNVCLLPRTVDICYTSDSFTRIKENYNSYLPFPDGPLPCKVDSQIVVVPYLTGFNQKEVSKGNREFKIFLMDTYLRNLLGKCAEESDEIRKKLMSLFCIYIFSFNSYYYVYPVDYPIITNMCYCPDGVLFRVRYASSGYTVFFPNEPNAQIETLGEWLE